MVFLVFRLLQRLGLEKIFSGINDPRKDLFNRESFHAAQM